MHRERVGSCWNPPELIPYIAQPLLLNSPKNPDERQTKTCRVRRDKDDQDRSLRAGGLRQLSLLESRVRGTVAVGGLSRGVAECLETGGAAVWRTALGGCRRSLPVRPVFATRALDDRRGLPARKRRPGAAGCTRVSWTVCESVDLSVVRGQSVPLRLRAATRLGQVRSGSAIAGRPYCTGWSGTSIRGSR